MVDDNPAPGKKKTKSYEDMPSHSDVMFTHKCLKDRLIIYLIFAVAVSVYKINYCSTLREIFDQSQCLT